ncbi:MAG: C25 family peptidase propeptide domain-containing protein, partial [Bacteroidota bacterium]|nr:C25 family peptidase propeptide domain-containing protein [Bacteroidota bacterium]
MKKFIFTSLLFLCMAFFAPAQDFSYSDTWGKAGFTMKSSDAQSMDIIFSVPSFSIHECTINGMGMKNVLLPGTFLFNDAGNPDLPVKSTAIAIPQGANVSLEIVSQRTEHFDNIDVAPAPVIPTDADDNPLKYEKNMSIYSHNAFFPASPVILNKVSKVRGVDVAMLSITPFQYNPVTKELVVYKDLKLKVHFNGGNSQF